MGKHVVRQYGILLGLLLLPFTAQAGDVAIRYAEFLHNGDGWRVSVTLQHADSGWEHYADGWRVVDAKGSVLGHRTLYHPHVEEQPFTRSLSNVQIPAGLKTVIVEAHDKVHGWSPDRLVVDLSRSQGKRYKIRR